MKINQTKLIELVGITAVILSLMFLAFEIRQSNRIAMTSAEGALRESARGINASVIESPELVDVLAKLQDSSGTLTSEEIILATNYLSAQISLWSSANEAFDNGLLSEYTYNLYLGMPGRVMVGYPGAVEHLANLADNYQFEYGMSAMWDSFLNELADRGYVLTAHPQQ